MQAQRRPHIHTQKMLDFEGQRNSINPLNYEEEISYKIKLVLGGNNYCYCNIHKRVIL